MLDAIIAIAKAFLDFLGIVSGGPQAKKVEEVMPEKSASEAALEALQKESPATSPAPKS